MAVTDQTASNRSHADHQVWAKPSPEQQACSKKTHLPVAGTLQLTRRVRLRMVLVPNGEFMMGSDLGYDNGERPVHRVKITRPFYIGIHPVTQSQYLAVTGENPSYFRGGDLPVENLSWEQAVAFCNKLSQLVHSEVRLPTEAEWEYACRAGAVEEYCYGDAEWKLGHYAWYGFDKCERMTHPVGRKLPNDWGIFDMHGNVWEWCEDWYCEHYYSRTPTMNPKGPEKGLGKVCRGGAWNYNTVNCRSAYRSWNPPTTAASHIGMRVRLSPRLR